MLEIFYFRVCLNSLINFKDLKNSQFFKYLFNPPFWLLILLIFVYFHHLLTLLKALYFLVICLFILFLFFFNFHINFIYFTKITSASWFDIFNSNFTNILVDFLCLRALLLIFSSFSISQWIFSQINIQQMITEYAQ